MFFARLSPLFARYMTPISLLEGTVKVNLCGDGIAEGPEQCDILDLKSLSCLDYGYNSGILSCDMTCEIRIGECFNYIEVEGEEPIIEKPQSSKPQYQEEKSYYPLAIIFLSYFDTDGDGILRSDELPYAVITWVNAWKYSNLEESNIKKSCDLNSDNICDIYDFSVLMYHTNSKLD